MQAMGKKKQSMISWFNSPRFEGIRRLYTPEQVEEQQGSIEIEYTIARDAAEAFFQRLRALFSERRQITTFGPYSPGQAVSMKRMGIEGVYLGGWATSAKGSICEDPGPDLASYPLSQVPDEAAAIVRALITADRNQTFARKRMADTERAATPVIDYRPFIIADADTGHGGDAHVRNLVRRFVEVGVPGYHIEDQKPGAKKCGHQGGKVLVPPDEQIKRLNAARFQLDLMRVPGLIVARTDAEAATLLDGRSDERDDPFVLGATNTELPGFKVSFIALMDWLSNHGVPAINGHLLYDIPEERMASALDWLHEIGLLAGVASRLCEARAKGDLNVDVFWDEVATIFSEAWSATGAVKTFGEAVSDVIRFRLDEGAPVEMTVEQWDKFVRHASLAEARHEAKAMSVDVTWDCELPRTPEGFYQIQGGIECAIARSLACAPYADLLWMETKTANLADAAKFAEGIHAVYPDKMLAYNLSPSFNWDTTGMSDEEMSRFPTELGKLGYVFNFITYGGHQVDGVASEEFATALKEDGMLALARLQRKLRLLNSSYRLPQSHVGGPRVDAALMASSGRTTSTKAMGKGSTQFQHVVQTEVPPKLLDDWIEIWKQHHGVRAPWKASLRPHQAGSDLLVLSVRNGGDEKIADIVFATIQDRRGRTILSVRDQNNYKQEVRRQRLMTLLHLFLVHRYKAFSVHYVSPTDDNQFQAEEMKSFGFYDEVTSEIGHIIVARVNRARINQWTEKDQTELKELIFHGAQGEPVEDVST